MGLYNIIEQGPSHHPRVIEFNGQQYLSTHEVMDRLNISISSVKRWHNAGHLKGIKDRLTGRVYYSRLSVDAARLENRLGAVP